MSGYDEGLNISIQPDDQDILEETQDRLEQQEREKQEREKQERDKDTRNKQFDVIKEVIADLDNLIIAGDFNICSPKEAIEKNIQSTNLSDCWVEIGCPLSIKWTYNGTQNTNINNKLKSRLDRIYPAIKRESEKAIKR